MILQIRKNWNSTRCHRDASSETARCNDMLIIRSLSFSASRRSSKAIRYTVRNISNYYQFSLKATTLFLSLYTNSWCNNLHNYTAARVSLLVPRVAHITAEQTTERREQITNLKAKKYSIRNNIHHVQNRCHLLRNKLRKQPLMSKAPPKWSWKYKRFEHHVPQYKPSR